MSLARHTPRQAKPQSSGGARICDRAAGCFGIKPRQRNRILDIPHRINPGEQVNVAILAAQRQRNRRVALVHAIDPLQRDALRHPPLQRIGQGFPSGASSANDHPAHVTRP